MTSRISKLMGSGVVLAGLAMHARSTAMAALLCIGIDLMGARRLALVTLIGLVAGAAAGLRIDALAAAGP